MADDTNPESVALLLSMMGGNCDEATVKRALTNCGGQVETAAEWLISHMASGGAGEPAAAPGGGQTAAGAEGEVAAPAAASAPGAEEPKAMSLVCLDCNKRLRNEDDCMAHAARTGHSNFDQSTEEIKPLTPEEKAEQLARLQEHMKKKKEEKAKTEEEEARKAEIARRLNAKDATTLKRERQEKEMQRQLEENKREKQREAAQRAKVKALIEEDRQRRLAAASKSTGAAEAAPPSAPAPVPMQVSAPVVGAAPAKTYTECRIQVRLHSGPAITAKLPPSATLQDVHDLVRAQRTDGVFDFNLTTAFPPRRVFGLGDMHLTLQDAGLMPSAVLTA